MVLLTHLAACHPGNNLTTSDKKMSSFQLIRVRRLEFTDVDYIPGPFSGWRSGRGGRQRHYDMRLALNTTTSFPNRGFHTVLDGVLYRI